MAISTRTSACVPGGKADYQAGSQGGIRRQTIANRLVPVAGGSAFKNKGVQYLLDAVMDYLPSPLDIPPAKGQNPDTGEPMEAPSDDNAKFCSLAFKLWSDPFVGKLVFFRVYSGKLSKGDTVYNPRTDKRERIGRLIQIQADKREDIDTCYSGDIAAMVGIKNITTGDTLCDEDTRSCLEPPSFPDPVISMAVEPRRSSTRKRCRTRCSVSPKRIRPSGSSPTRRPARRSSPAWASFTSRSFAIACSGNSRSRPTPASRRLPTRKPSLSGRWRRQAHQAVRRTRPIRSRHHQDRAQRARQGNHDREQGRRRHHSQGIHPRL